MKKLLLLILVTMLLLPMATAVSAEGESDKAIMDSSVFFVETQEAASCGCYEMGLDHMATREYPGVIFFKWMGSVGMEKTPKEKVPTLQAFSCFAGRVSGVQTIVFLDGVPNLVNDLFKVWEGTTKDVYIPDSVTEIDENCFVDGSDITLHFTENNKVALTYAQNRRMAFEVMDAEKRISGDVNFDESVDMKDVLTLRQMIAGLPTACEIGSTNVNGDDSTDMKDVLTLCRKIANLKS